MKLHFVHQRGTSLIRLVQIDPLFNLCQKPKMAVELANMSDFLRNWVDIFLAVQNSSIGDLVTHSLTH